MSWIAGIGQRVVDGCRKGCRLASLATSIIWLSLHHNQWPRSVRTILARQMLFTGVDASTLIILIAVLTGMSVVLQAQLWLSRLGQSEMLGHLLVGVLIRELGPLLVNFLVVGRSGTAMAIELGNMRVGGEIRVLEAQGVEPVVYLLMPRIIGMALSIFALNALLCATALLSGFGVGVLMRITPPRMGSFFVSVLSAIQPADIWNMLLKTLLSGVVVGSICCMEGMAISGVVTEVPQAATRAVVRSITAILILFAVVSLFTYA